MSIKELYSWKYVQENGKFIFKIIIWKINGFVFNLGQDIF